MTMVLAGGGKQMIELNHSLDGAENLFVSRLKTK